MKTRSQIFFGRVAAVALMLGISMLGNLRSQASETPSSIPSDSPATPRPTQVNTLRVAGTNTLRASGSTLGSDEDDITDGENVAPADGDDGHLVPAIYAWDPDVRFVYYRHISKWM